MFNSSVALIPPFNNEIKNRICTETADSMPDDSLFMTLTALMYRRNPDFSIRYIYCRDLQKLSGYINSENNEAISFIYLASDIESEDNLPSGGTSFPKHDKFLQDKLNTSVTVKVYNKNTILVCCRRMTLAVFHVVQIFLPAYLPDLFKDIPFTDAERNLLVSLSKLTSDPFKKEMQSMLMEPEFRKYLLYTQMCGFEKRIRQRKYDAAMEQVNNILRNMEQAMERYRVACTQKRSAEALARGLKDEMDDVSGHTEFEEYLCENKLLSNINIAGNSISFIIKTFVNPYLPDDWESLSSRGSIFSGYGRTNSVLDDEENLKLLLDAIFSRNHTLKLKMCAVISMDYYGSSVTSVTGYNYEEIDPDFKNYVPNAHLDRHNCFGQNKLDILEQMNNGDMIGAVECCINVAKRINVSEGATFGPFVESLKRNKGKCIVCEKDGQEMTIKEAVKYLKEKNDEASSDTNGEESVA